MVVQVRSSSAVGDHATAPESNTAMKISLGASSVQPKDDVASPVDTGTP